MRRETIDWKRIFAKNTSDKELLSKTQRNLKLNNKKMNNATF